MGGVDVHDQLWLQRYSVQLAMTFKKYYQTLFLGLLDVALENALVVQRTYYANLEKQGMTHAEFLTALQAELFVIKAEEIFSNTQQSEGFEAPSVIAVALKVISP